MADGLLNVYAWLIVVYRLSSSEYRRGPTAQYEIYGHSNRLFMGDISNAAVGPLFEIKRNVYGSYRCYYYATNINKDKLRDIDCSCIDVVAEYAFEGE